MNGYRKGNAYFYTYPSVAAIAELATNAPSELGVMVRASRRVYQDGASWAGGTFEDASRLARDGDMEGARRLAPAILTRVNEMQAVAPRLDPVYRVDEGRWIDVARFVKGEPECWGDMIEVETSPRRGINVIINTSVNAGVDSRRIDNAGVLIGSAILGLMARGLNVQLYIGDVTTSGMERLLVCAPLNANGGPLDAARLSSVLRPWFQRRIIFGWQETLPGDMTRRFGIGYGSYGGYDRMTQHEADELTGKPGTVLIEAKQIMDSANGQAILERALSKGGY